MKIKLKSIQASLLEEMFDCREVGRGTNSVPEIMYHDGRASGLRSALFLLSDFITVEDFDAFLKIEFEKIRLQRQNK